MGIRELFTQIKEQSNGAEQIRLAPAGRLYVGFSGLRGADGPLTLGQGNTLQWVADIRLFTRMTDWVLEMPEGTTLDDIAAAFSVLMARHESLRTTYPAQGQPIQRVARWGDLVVELYDVDAEQADDPALASVLVGRLRATEFSLATELPLRVAVALSRGVPKVAAVVYSHMAVDFASMAVVGRQFTQLAGDPASREVGPPGHQPLDQAAAERSAHGRGQAEAGLRNWERHLRSMPQCLYSVPSAGLPASGAPVAGWLWSRAAALALPHIAARTGTSRQAAVLAALCAVLRQRTGQDRCVLPGPVDNRYRRLLREYVGSLAHDSIISVDVTADGFDELVGRAAAGTLKACRNGLVDRAEILRVVSEVDHDRGTAYARDCVFKDISSDYTVGTALPAAPGDPAEAAQALGQSELWWVDAIEIEEVLLFTLVEVDEEVILGALSGDSGRVPRQEVESLLRGVEALLVAAAAADLDLGRVGEITGIRPVSRGPGWLRVDSCWIELREVQRLLDDALGVPAARVFAIADPAGEPALVAYLAAGEGMRTPEQVHAACMAVLPGHRRPQPPDGMRYTAMTPGRYVICAGAPDDLSDLAAWRRQPVLASGDGRARKSPDPSLAIGGAPGAGIGGRRHAVLP